MESNVIGDNADVMLFWPTLNGGTDKTPPVFISLMRLMWKLDDGHGRP